MKKRFLFALLCLFGGAAQAETDYLCLKTCVHDGETSSACMKKCTYDPTGASTSGATQLDYQCLKPCKDLGGDSATCVNQCTKAPTGPGDILPEHADAPGAPSATVHDTQIHNQFHAPQPAGDLVLSKPVMSHEAPNEDYQCVKLCAQGGLQYDLCKQRCMKP